MKYFVEGFRNYFNFSGRATRKQYWIFYAWYILIAIVCVVIDIMIGTDTVLGNNGLLGSLVTLVFFIPNLSIAVRRLHDTDREGSWILIGVIPILGALYLLYLFCKDSGPDNEYGISPKYPNAVQLETTPS